MREVREETGLHITLLNNFREQVTYSPRAGIIKDVVYFLGYAENSKTVRQEEEISEIRWVDLKECHRFLSYNNDRSLLDRAKNYLQKTAPTPDARKNTAAK